MKLLKQLGILFGVSLAGDLLSKLAGLPIPGNVLGMLLLFLLLCLKIVKVEQLREVTDFLLSNIAFFFVPAGVGLILCSELLKGGALSFLTICIAVTILVLALSGQTVQLVQRLARKRREKQ